MKNILLITCVILIFSFQTSVSAVEIEKEIYPLKVLKETTIFEIHSQEVKALQRVTTGEGLTQLYKVELYRVRLSDGTEGWINSDSVEEPMTEYFKEGYKYYTDEQYDSSIEIYKDILKTDPANARAHFWLAKNYWKIGEESLATDELDEALNLDENDTDALQMRSQMDYIYFKRSIRATRKANAKKETIKSQPLPDKAKIIELVSNSATKKGTSVSKALDELSKLTESLGNTVIPKGWAVEADAKEKGKYLAHYMVDAEYFTWQVVPSSGSVISANKNAELLMNKW